MHKINKFLLLGLCIILITSFVIPLNSQIARAQFTEEEEEINRLYKDYLKLKAEIDKKEAKLDELLKLARQCIITKYDTSEIEAQIAGLEARLKQLEADLAAIDINKLKEEIKKLKDELKKKRAELRKKKADLKKKQAELRKKELELTRKMKEKAKGEKKITPELQELYDRLKKAQEKYKAAKTQDEKDRWDWEIGEIESACRVPERDAGLKGYRKLLAEIAKLEKEVNQLRNDVTQLQNDIRKLQSDIKRLKALIPKLESAVNNYNRIKNGIRQLKNEINKLKQKVALLNKLLGLKQQRAKETDAHKISDLDDEIRKVIGDINRLLGGLPPAAPPTKFEISGNFIYSGVGMGGANDYISWINTIYSGDITKITEGTGFSGTFLYQLSSMVGLGFSYEYLSASGQGELTNPFPPPLTLDNSQTFSTNGLLGIITITIPEEIENFDIRGIFGIGLYLSTYEDSENDFDRVAHGVSIGGKGGMGCSYMFGNNFGVCGNVFYRVAPVDQFTDSAGFPILFFNGKPARADFSGFGAEAGVLIRL